MRPPQSSLAAILCMVCFVGTGVYAQDDPGAVWQDLNRKVQELQEKGDHAAARNAAKRALTVAEDGFGSDDPRVGTTLNNLGVSYFALREPKKAEPLFVRAIDIGEKAHPPDDLALASTRANLAFLYEFEGKHARAEPLFESALAAREKALGLESPQSLDVAEGLCAVYRAEGREDDAYDLEQRVTGAESDESAADVVLPVLVKRVDPQYPESARARRLEGTVMIQAVIFKDGSVRFARVVKSTNSVFDSPALHAVRLRTYVPASHQGKPISIYFTIRVGFNAR